MPSNTDWIEEIIRITGSNSDHYMVDVGANVGEVSRHLLQHFPLSSLLSFEPCKSSYQTLSQNLKGFQKATCLPFALGSSNGIANLHTFTDHLCNTLNPDLNESWLHPTGVETVELLTLDDVARERNIQAINILKIDVEGYELSVLRGAINLLRAHRIRFIYAEVGFHKNRRHQYFGDLIEFMTALEYDLCGFFDAFKDGKKKQYIMYCNALFMFKPRVSWESK